MSSGNLKSISNNAKEIQKSKKGIKKFEYLKNSISPNGSIFLLERHSSIDDGKRWCDEFNGNFHFSHGKTNFYIRRRGWEGFIDSKLDAQDGNSILSLVKLIRFKETQDLCDKWGEKIRNLID